MAFTKRKGDGTGSSKVKPKAANYLTGGSKVKPKARDFGTGKKK